MQHLAEAVRKGKTMADKLILAAGGIVEKHTTEGLKIAIICRTRYGEEWALPKGKLKKKNGQTCETFLEAAQREVREETGCPVKVTDFAGSTNYSVNDATKLVVYWRMVLTGECAKEPTDSEEVKIVKWLTPEKAIEILTHDEDKNLLKQVFFSHELLAPRESFGRIKIAFIRLFSSRRWRRLASALTAYRVELERRANRRQGPPSACTWVGPAFEAMCSAELALRNGDIDKGWKCFNAAQRMELFALKPGDELQSRVITLKEEAEKLRSWRKRATYELLSGLSNDTSDVEKVYVAALLRDEHYANLAYKDGILRTHFTFLGLILIAVLLILFVLAFGGILTAVQSPDPLMFLCVGLFGLFGGTVSAIFKAPKSTQSSRIPELTATIRIALLRICMSIASALIVYIFVISELSDKLNLKTTDSYTIFATSFVAGFTERLMMRAIGHMAGN
jgi:ADP-ribose pyrophosphatase YjhB (NUDIX family)